MYPSVWYKRLIFYGLYFSTSKFKKVYRYMQTIKKKKIK